MKAMLIILVVHCFLKPSGGLINLADIIRLAPSALPLEPTKCASTTAAIRADIEPFFNATLRYARLVPCGLFIDIQNELLQTSSNRSVDHLRAFWDFAVRLKGYDFFSTGHFVCYTSPLEEITMFATVTDWETEAPATSKVFVNKFKNQPSLKSVGA